MDAAVVVVVFLELFQDGPGPQKRTLRITGEGFYALHGSQ